MNNLLPKTQNQMSEKYQNKYRIKPARHPLWNYENAAAYFITICTENRKHYFGCVINGKFDYSTIGEIVKQQWEMTPEIRPDMNLVLGEFVVMPNHFHGIIQIGVNEFNDGRDAMPCVCTMGMCRDAMPCVCTMGTNQTTNQFGPQSKNLASIIRGFKSAVTKNARLIDVNFGWQSRYHDHIIRNEKSFQRISNYIINNPMLWKEDKFYNDSP